jgi:membrane protease YdiL (CAAX protease family)
MSSKVRRVLEFWLLFVGLPLAFRYIPSRPSPLPALWLVAGYCLYVLRSDPSFDRSQLWNSQSVGGTWLKILALFSISAILVTALVYVFAPQSLFSFVRTHPVFWALMMVLYPVLSVYPQGIVYRAFIFQRYRDLFETPLAIILVSAAAFAFVHIIFRSSISIGLTFIGGLIFAKRYLDTHSLLTSAVEHALYGCLMFTVGLGQYFYHGARL